MNGKLVRTRGGLASARSLNGVDRVRALRRSVVALTTYIVDADPHALIIDRVSEVLSLDSYARALETLEVVPGEKVEDWGSRNLVGSALEVWQQQMVAAATMAQAAAKTILHIVLSLESTEEWTGSQAEETIEIVLSVLGLAKCMVVWARHGNTLNPHLHLCVIRVDPITGGVVGSEWLVDDLHQTLALVDERHGRARSPDALYFAKAGAVFDVETGALVRDAAGNYIREWYLPFGRKRNHLAGPLREIKADLIASAEQSHTWDSLHKAFGEIGAVFESAGSGGRIRRGACGAKASHIHASLSRNKLEDRLGPFEPDCSRINPGYLEFCSEIERRLANLRKQRERVRERLKQIVARILAHLSPAHRVFLKVAIEAEAKEGHKAIGDAFAVSIRSCAKQRLSEKAWLEAGKPGPADVAQPVILLPGEGAAIDTAGIAQPVPPQAVAESGIWATEHFDADGRVLFVDHRHFIVIHRPDDTHAVDVALRMAEERWQDVQVAGSADFLKHVANRAAGLDLRVTGEEGLLLEPHYEVEIDAKSGEQVNCPLEPAPRIDPEYDARVKEAIEKLAQLDYLPLRRIPRTPGMPVDRLPPLELALGRDPFDFYDSYLEYEALLDQDPRIQECLEKSRAVLLEELRAYLLHSELDQFPATFDEMANGLRRDPKLHRAAYLVRDEQEFADMWLATRETWLRLEREREAYLARSRASKRATSSGRASDQSLKEIDGGSNERAEASRSPSQEDHDRLVQQEALIKGRKGLGHSGG